MVGTIVVGAHPDDAELGAGGSLSKGGYILSMTNGSNGSRDSKIARFEMTRSAEILGVSFDILGLPSLTVVSHRIVSDLDRILSEVRPDVVVTHHPDDTNQEHALTSRAVLAACRRSDRFLFFEPIPPVGRFKFAPQLYADISASRKYEALKEYRSQMIRRGRDLVETREKLDAWRGCEIGVEYAEAFEVCRWTW